MRKKIKTVQRYLEHRINLLYTSYLRYKYIRGGKIPWTKGYSQYKYNLIGSIIQDKKILPFFNKGFLPNGYGYRIDERIVEYPWFFSKLTEKKIRLLDAGSVLNFKQIINSPKLHNKIIYIATLANEGKAETNQSVSYLYEDLRNMCIKNNFFDTICCLSTIEHIGMNNTLFYTSDKSKNENDKYSYLKAIEEYSRVLKKNGTVYLSMPFGKYKNHKWFQVFDSKMVEKIIEVFNPSKVRKYFFKYENDQWNFSDERRCKNGYCFDINTTKRYEKDFLAFSRCVICIEMTKK